MTATEADNTTTRTDDTDSEWSDEQAQNQFVWLTGQSGNELIGFAGGATHQPRFSGAAVEQLRRIAEVANALADRYEDEPEASVDNPAETPREELPEQTQKDLAEQENADDPEAKRQEQQATPPQQYTRPEDSTPASQQKPATRKSASGSPTI
jgi:hypothetical protein